MVKKMHTVSKSKLKAQALSYFRKVQSTGESLIITDHGHPVLKIIPYVEDMEKQLKSLRGSILKYENPFDPVGEGEWEASQ